MSRWFIEDFSPWGLFRYVINLMSNQDKTNQADSGLSLVSIID